MKRVYKFKKGDSWDGDEKIFHDIEEYLTIYPEAYSYPIIKKDSILTITFERKEGQG